MEIDPKVQDLQDQDQDLLDAEPDDDGITVEGPSSNETAPQFEWIHYGDANARRRARAHVTRTFRRQKATQSQKQKEKEPEKSGGSHIAQQRRSVTPLVQKHHRNITRHVGITQSHNQGSSSSSSSNCSSPSAANLALVPKPQSGQPLLRRTLGSGRGDPFDAFPVTLSPQDRALLDHFLFRFEPFAWSLDKRADFSPVKTLMFNFASSEASCFHLILSSAATDLAAKSGRAYSEASIKHRSTALNLLRKKVLDWKPNTMPSDELLATIMRLAGDEMTFGSPQTFNIHMDGLASIIKVRGGLESIRETNPQLYAYLCVIDYSSASMLASKRRFLLTTDGHEPFRTDPLGVPEKVVRRLPPGFDLYEEVGSIIQGMQDMTLALRADNSAASRNIESNAIVESIDTKLTHSMSIPDKEGGGYRRRYILQSFQVLFLIYTTLVSGYEGPAGELFIYRFEKAMVEKGLDFGNAIANLFSLLLAGDDLASDTLAACLSELVDVAVTLDCSSWRDVRNALLNFFVYDPACYGELQDLWKGRMEAILGQASPLLVGQGSPLGGHAAILSKASPGGHESPLHDQFASDMQYQNG